MKTWKKGVVTLATEQLRQAVAGKKIALMMNTSAIDNEGRLLLDVMVEEKWAEIVFFFGMEHGVRGNLYAADSAVGNVDTKTGTPIVNLYDFPGFQALGLRIRLTSLLGTWMTFTISLPSMSLAILLSAVTISMTAASSLPMGTVTVDFSLPPTWTAMVTSEAMVLLSS